MEGSDGETLRAVVRVCRGASPAEVLDVTSAEAWVAFDAGVRNLDDRPWLSPRPPEKPARPARTLLDRLRGTALPRTAPPPPSPPPLAIALCHPDGRVREAALEEARTAPELRPLLVVRCSDWALPVRERARALLAELPGSALLPLAELILLLSRRSRGEGARSLLERALREGPAADVVALTARRDRATYRLAYRIAVERGLLTPAELATTAATTGDVTLQDLCAEAAVAALPEREPDGHAVGDEAVAVLGRLLTARAARVRAAGVTALRRTGRHGEARPFLADRSAVVRACARYVLRQGGIDPLPVCRALCAEPAARPGAAAGLGECGERGADADRLWALVEHPVPAVRLHAITGLRALDEVVRERLTPSLDDPSPAVVRAATGALLPEAAGIPEALLRERTAPERPRAVRVAAKRLLRAAGRSSG
ncbi:hypothetical protein [Streptomyces sp. cmx-18-6]|uniref:hypothetical protein n=1 Tax=Streptomyces sp. cmx-18-6 TaxID=2790930 RepID=UPI00397F5A34